MIPMKILLVHFLFVASVIAFVVICGSLFFGNQRYLDAKALYDSGQYNSAYQKLEGVNKLTSKGEKLKTQAKLLADLETKLDSYQSMMTAKKYSMALNSLIMGYGRYKEHAAEAEKDGILDTWNAYGAEIVQALSSQFNLTEDQAADLYEGKNRANYTIRMKEILEALNMNEEK